MRSWRTTTSFALAISFGLCILPAGAQESYVRITAPAEGATLARKQRVAIAYEVRRGSKGHHVHLYVDGKEIAILRELEASHTLKALSPGERTVCIKVVNRAHVPIGVEHCIRVKVK